MPQRGQQIEMQTISVNSLLTILMLKIVRTVISALTDFTGMKVLLFPGFETSLLNLAPFSTFDCPQLVIFVTNDDSIVCVIELFFLYQKETNDKSFYSVIIVVWVFASKRPKKQARDDLESICDSKIVPGFGR